MGARVTRVLVVEDDPDIREVLVEALRDDGSTVDWAHNGLDGLASPRNRLPMPPIRIGARPVAST